jgi:hypothetical protein
VDRPSTNWKCGVRGSRIERIRILVPRNFYSTSTGIACGRGLLCHSGLIYRRAEGGRRFPASLCWVRRTHRSQTSWSSHRSHIPQPTHHQWSAVCGPCQSPGTANGGTVVSSFNWNPPSAARRRPPAAPCTHRAHASEPAGMPADRTLRQHARGHGYVTGPALGAPSGEVGGLQRARHEIRETCVSSSRYQ